MEITIDSYIYICIYLNVFCYIYNSVTPIYKIRAPQQKLHGDFKIFS
jgi:hypothetical protein